MKLIRTRLAVLDNSIDETPAISIPTIVLLFMVLFYSLSSLSQAI